MKTQKELKEQYKQMKFKMGVFQIRNMVNGKVFIGGSRDLIANWNLHKFQLNAGLHPNEALQNDWKQFGAESFAYEILEEIKQVDDSGINYFKEVKALEDMIIDDRQPFDIKGYNKKPKV